MARHLYGSIIPENLIARLENAKDAAAEGERICIELVEELASIPGIAGVHVMAPANAVALPRVLAEARRRLPRQTCG
jgi:methylenetetrahydrofolate reductase (NADPH)